MKLIGRFNGFSSASWVALPICSCSSSLVSQLQTASKKAWLNFMWLETYSTQPFPIEVFPLINMNLSFLHIFVAWYIFLVLNNKYPLVWMYQNLFICWRTCWFTSKFWQEVVISGVFFCLFQILLLHCWYLGKWLTFICINVLGSFAIMSY